MYYPRLCIYPKNVQRITGKSYTSSCRLIHQIKVSLSKKNQHFLTIEEFSRYLGLPMDKLKEFME
ncbi:MAG: hypothetical protein EPN39_09515 [Chitinophagaceae bacterium]|nr:MAG: hypothetical protein EPN39_09515 [Chitinophagaceae bacterium]